jgi:hypothetical protein
LSGSTKTIDEPPVTRRLYIDGSSGAQPKNDIEWKSAVAGAIRGRTFRKHDPENVKSKVGTEA